MWPLYIVVAVPIAIVCAVALRVGRRRPERAALLLGVLIVTAGTLVTSVQVAEGIADAQTEFTGRLAMSDIRDVPQQAIDRHDAAYLDSARGVMVNPHAGAGAIGTWAVSRLAPWLLAAAVLAIFAPVLVAAERGDPFSDARFGARMRATGVVLLVGIPALPVLRYLADEAGSSGLSYGALVEPDLTLSAVHVLPGLLVLVLAGVFTRGSALRDLERHTV